VNLETGLAAALDAVQNLLDTTNWAEVDLAGPTPCVSFTVAELMNHIRDTHLLLTNAAADDDATNETPLPDCHAVLAAAATFAWTNRGQEGTVNIGGNELPATFALSLHLVETLIHSWDLASALGQTLELSESLVDLAWEVIPGVASEDARGADTQAAYGPVQSVHPTADALERLVAFAGRDPRWSAGLAA
jgi:uncharacterized protein (TIGR03086 family)